MNFHLQSNAIVSAHELIHSEYSVYETDAPGADQTIQYNYTQWEKDIFF